MKAMLLRAAAAISTPPLRLEDVPDPRPAADEILIKVSACAVCRTDLQLTEGDLAAQFTPFIPGHQVTGEVVATGSTVEGWQPGDRAAAGWLASTCGVCAYCRAGRENLCPDAQFTGWSRNGGYAEYVAVRSAFAFKVPQGFADLAAAPLLCGGVIGYRSLKRSAVQPGQRLGLFGYGASAHLTIQVARHWGCEVFVWTRSAQEQQRALATGAAWAGSYGDHPGVAMDAAITFAPVGDVVISALESVTPGGTVAINAIHLDRIPEFSYDLLWRERNLVSVANYTRQDATELLDLAATIPIATDIETLPLSAANDALQRLKDGRLRGTAVLCP
ncbi:MAG: zinc-dependent alcohol dehydrogenase family protein [Dehalococcoidia bacterium]